jgi:hypothetical protein
MVLRVAVAGAIAGMMLSTDGAEAAPSTSTTARSSTAPAQATPRRTETRRPETRRSETRRVPARRSTAARATLRPAMRDDGATTRQAVLAALTAAAARTRTEPELLAAMASRESRLNPRAANSQSTARGLMQFTESTWLEAVRDHGAAHGLAQEAATLRTDPQTGTVHPRNARDRAYLLNMRYNPRLAAALAGERTAAARAALASELGRPLSSADLYAVHMMGMAGARRFLTALAATPSRPAAEIVGSEAVLRNRNVFVTREGRLRSVQEVHADFARDAAEGSALIRPVQTASR